LEGAFDLVLSADILREYRDVFARLDQSITWKDALLEAIAHDAIWSAPVRLPPSVCTDLDDVKFLECAVTAAADFVITGDRALLRCDGYAGIRVVRPRSFLTFLGLG
jgi:predicted nucleic acid-binding protein